GRAAALFAGAGFTGAEQPLEGRYGFAAVTSDSIGYDSITGKLGESWEILANAYKPYPCGVVLFAVIDACLVRRRHLRPAEQIVQVIVRGHPRMLERADRPAVETGRKAKVSI